MTDPTLTIPTTNSTSQEWKQWHKTLLTVFNRDKANAIWVAFWAKRGNGHDSSALRDYMKSQGVDMDTSIFTDIMDTGSGLVKSGINAIKFPFETIGTIIGVGKWVAIGFVVIILGSVSLLVINIARKPVEVIGAAKGIMGK